MIDEKKLIEELVRLSKGTEYGERYDAFATAMIAVEDMPKLDGYIDQIKWERDVALDTLKQHGIGLGETTKPRDGEWIPVSEQKPGEGSYEVTVRGKKHGLISVETAVYRESCDEWTVNLFIPYPVEVIAWRKKPEPYKEVEHD